MALSKDKEPEQQEGFRKIVIGRLAVDPVFLLLFLFFTTGSLLLLSLMLLSR